MCLQCGKIGCCDNSPNRHATGHFEDTGHPLIRSAEPNEDWRWCYVDALPVVDSGELTWRGSAATSRRSPAPSWR